jgi:hypothetical protein
MACGHPELCKCVFCSGQDYWIRLADGTPYNVTAAVLGGSAKTQVSGDIPENPCPPTEYRRGKPVVPKGKKRR